MPPPPRKALPFTSLTLRQRERGLVVGGVDTGKSTLCDMLGAAWDQDYAAKGGRRLIFDTKPRYRAQWTTQGTSARSRYKGWDHGPSIPGSVVVDTADELDMAFGQSRVVIVQRNRGPGDQLPRMLDVAHAFLDSSRTSRPQLAQVDETLDWFHANGMPRGGSDVIVQLARAGRERGTACLYATQRMRGLAVTLKAELTKAYVLRLDDEGDLKELRRMGMPAFHPTVSKHVFNYWTKEDYPRVFGPYRLNLPEHGWSA